MTSINFLVALLLSALTLEVWSFQCNSAFYPFGVCARIGDPSYDLIADAPKDSNKPGDLICYPLSPFCCNKNATQISTKAKIRSTKFLDFCKKSP
ncbi:hypothetical protein PGT21_019528 [Puccinia graminis f. sp. tritici]|uniref:Uncharacterized protein n=1 Tax=Puccinia graminis f. sp. tritici TaxID=56615 RepID=A0A5B0QXN4_PUCGR|nr:hypothetical protein PGT21_019528 [Puccinia graminis f. sp. tritici]KAA1138093.1 hypothetical protein PGTUg99_030516 [Puccinia graminis f. sp. tritici]